MTSAEGRPLPPHRDVQLLSEERLHEGVVFDLLRQRLRLPSGLEQSLDLIAHSGAVCVLARDESGRVLLVRQYRAAASAWLEEIPAGRLEPHEDPLVAARRELEEETGYRAARWRHVRTFFVAPGFASEVMHLFEATELSAVPGGGLACDDDEELSFRWAEPAELLTLEPQDAKTLVAALACLDG